VVDVPVYLWAASIYSTSWLCINYPVFYMRTFPISSTTNAHPVNISMFLFRCRLFHYILFPTPVMFIFIIALKLLYSSCCYISYPVFLCLRHEFAIDVLLLKFYLSIST